MVTSQFGEIDFSADNIGIEIIKSLYENNFPYLEITNEGNKNIYGVVTIPETNEIKNKSKRAKKTM